jgi:hypothetical protein
MTFAHIAVTAGLVSTLMAAPVAAQSPMANALALYAAASYDDALAAFDDARKSQPTGDDLVTIERHRLLCLVALGRTAAANDVVAGLLDARPDFVLTAGEASPRVRAVFESARARVLPELVRRRYAEAKRAFDAGEFAVAQEEFARVSALLADPVASGHDPASADLQVLANGFQQLSALAVERARASKDLATVQAAMRVMQTPAMPPTAMMMPSSAMTSPAMLDPNAMATPVLSAAAATVAPVVDSPRFTPLGIFTYDWRDTEVAPPVAVAQPMSGWWGSMGEPAAGTQLGAIEVVVDESGAVTDARVYLSVNRVYDKVLLESVKRWRYRPAMKGGRPVKYRRVTGVVSGR